MIEEINSHIICMCEPKKYYNPFWAAVLKASKAALSYLSVPNQFLRNKNPL